MKYFTALLKRFIDGLENRINVDSRMSNVDNIFLMIYYISIIKSLLTQFWYFPLLLLVTLATYFLLKPQPESLAPAVLTKNNNKGVWLAALVTFIVFSAPYWMFGNDMVHGGSDDTSLALQAYLNS
jgi:hypothetical protein